MKMEAGNLSETLVAVYETGCAQILQKSWIRLKIIGPVGLTRSRLHTDNPQILGEIIKKNHLPLRPAARGLCTPVSNYTASHTRRQA
jgi:hypothetical protein